MDKTASAMVLLLISLISVVKAAEWNYVIGGPKGPGKWKDAFPVCGASKQSPINIFEGDVEQTTMTPFSFTNYNTADSVSVGNNGHSVVVDLMSTPEKTMGGGGLTGTFRAAQFHFHWGKDDSTGSEHLISTKAYPMELHIVHYNQKYASLGEALPMSDGLAVLGFMFEVAPTDNAAYSEIINALSGIKDPKTYAPVAGTITLSDLMADTANFYRYQGSLTTPTCDESVTWTVFTSTIKISSEQMESFRLLMDSDDNVMVDNYRPVLPLNGRVVQASFNPDIKWGYLNNGANQWPLSYEVCGGVNQSPVDISTTTSVLDATIPPLQFFNYGGTAGITMELSNNGHAAVVTYTSGILAVTGGGLGETYTTAQFHLHWGATDMRGSEHTLDASMYPAELHIVHYKTALGSLGAAVKQPRGLAVLGFFVEISETDNPAWAPILDGLAFIRSPKSKYNMSQVFSLNSILPDNRNDFYRYDGSLTTPGCFESVVWTVFKDTIKMSANQLERFRALQSSEKNVNNVNVALVDNYRPVQPLGARVIRRTFRTESIPWSYEGPYGVQTWAQNFPGCASTGARAQSPVDIVDTDSRYLNIVPISLSGYSGASGAAWELSNNGHSVTATLQRGDISISGGGFTDEYKVAQFHFHWGSSSDKGSEHLINSKAYPMELHIVHFAKSLGSLGNAVAEPNGLAVLGFMFEVSSSDNPYLDPIVDKLDQVPYKGNASAMASFDLRDIIPVSLADFYRYSGSLTTPACFESVTWTVFRSTIAISESQLQKFRAVISSDKDPVTQQYKPMVNNYRPPQPLNGRVVYANFKLDPDAGVGFKASLVVCVICLLFSTLISFL